MSTTAAQLTTLTSLLGDSCTKRGWIMFGHPIQCASQAVIMQQVSREPFSSQMLHWLLGKQLGHHVHLTIAEASPVEHHRHRRCSHTDQVPSLACLLISPLSQASFSTRARHNPHVIQPFVLILLICEHAFSSFTGFSSSPSFPFFRQPFCGMWGEEACFSFDAGRRETLL